MQQRGTKAVRDHAVPPSRAVDGSSRLSGVLDLQLAFDDHARVLAGHPLVVDGNPPLPNAGCWGSS